MLKIFSKLTIAAMAVALGVSIPAHYAPAMAAGETKYISEVKVGIGKTEQEAKSELLEEGFTILSKDGKYADLNEDAGSKDPTMGRGQKIVYLGYKTTTNVDEAVTDLAVMNMRGGYSVKDYEELMEKQLKTEVIPFVERFLVTLQEYRENLNSEYPSNKARAQYMKSMLNKLSDDDTGGLMGDLLVNETKYEMGDADYAALSEEEKKQHADILTIIMQANGKATLSIETLLTKATDTKETSWIDRLEENTLDDLKEQLDEAGVDITEQDATLDRMYGDDAKKLLEKWDTFSQALNEYDEKVNALANLDESRYEENVEKMEQFDVNSDDVNKNGPAVVALTSARVDITNETLDLELIAAKERMDEVDYDFEDGSTLAEFFAQDASVFNGDDIRDLYPIVASLSAGQLAGLDFLSLQDLVTIATADATSYENDLGDTEPASIYEGVNREIFQKGMVAITNDAKRLEAMQNDAVKDSPLSTNTWILWGATAVATAGMITSWVLMSHFKDVFNRLDGAENAVRLANKQCTDKLFKLANDLDLSRDAYKNAVDAAHKTRDLALEKLVGKDYVDDVVSDVEGTIKNAATKSKICTYLGAAFTVAMAALAAFSIYSTVTELIAYYNVEYSPIPKYMVEEVDITEGEGDEKTYKRNDTAYYRVAECNRKPNADYYEQLQNYADLNGDVGKQWLALYYVRYEGKAPIKADSLKVVIGDSKTPAGYEIGIHMFGYSGAFNLTDKHYCYNDTPKGTYVYFQVDESALPKASVAGSNFSTGTGFLFAGIGAVVGAGIGIAIMLVLTKRKEKVVKE